MLALAFSSDIGQSANSATEYGGIKSFGDYQLLQEVARGGMGIVWKARQRSLNRIVAVKVLLTGQFSSADYVRRFQTEAEAAANLQHPNIVAIHEVGIHEGQHYFSMDFVDGQSLAQLARERPLPAKLVAQHVKTIALAIHYAHQRGILHRDLKPSNILIDSMDRPRITDFGLAKRLNEVSDLTLTGQVLGTPHYMSPEQAEGRHAAVTVASDVFSLGAILYFLLGGRPPFSADSVGAVLELVCRGNPVSLRQLMPKVPLDLETICFKCLNKRPSDRYASAEALADDLERWLSGEPIWARPASVIEKLSSWCRRKPALAGALGVMMALCLVIAIGGALAFERIKRERDRAATHAQKSAQVALMLKEMLRTVNPEVAKGKDLSLLRTILERTEQRLDTDLKGQPEVQAELRQIIGETYNLGLSEPVKAEPPLREALRLNLALYGENAEATLQSLFHLALALRNQDRIPDFAVVMQKAIAVQLKLHGENNVSTADMFNNLALAAASAAEAEALNRRSLSIFERMGLTNHFSYGVTLSNIGDRLYDQLKLEEAESYAQRAVETLVRVFGERTSLTAFCKRALGTILTLRGPLEQAEKSLRESFETYRELYGPDHPKTVQGLADLAMVLRERGQTNQAQELLQEVRDRVFGWTNIEYTGETGYVLGLLGVDFIAQAWRYSSLHDSSRAVLVAKDAEEILRRLSDLRETKLGEKQWQTASARSLLGGAIVAVAALDIAASREQRLDRLAEARSSLVKSYESLLKHHEQSASAQVCKRIEETLESLVLLEEVALKLAPDTAGGLPVKQWTDLLGQARIRTKLAVGKGLPGELAR